MTGTLHEVVCKLMTSHWKMLQKEYGDKIKTYILCSIIFFCLSNIICFNEIMLENEV